MLNIQAVYLKNVKHTSCVSENVKHTSCVSEKSVFRLFNILPWFGLLEST